MVNSSFDNASGVGGLGGGGSRRRDEGEGGSKEGTAFVTAWRGAYNYAAVEGERER